MAAFGAVYGYSPPFLQNVFLSGRGMLRALALEMAGVGACQRSLLRTESMSAQELDLWQSQMLTALLRHASARVPFYRGLRPPSMANAHDAKRLLAAWPLLYKQDVVHAGSRFRLSGDALRHAAFSASTSGSTGAPMKLLRTPHAIALEHALVERQMRWAGWRRGMRRVWLRGDTVVPLDGRQAPFWRHDKAQSMLMCSAFHLSEQTAPQYLQAIEAFNPALIQAYPSAIAFLARWMLENRRPYRGSALRGIMTSSERLTDVWRRECQRAFSVKVFDWFGQSERVAAIGTCELGNYHIIEDGSLVQLRARGDGSASLVGTNFHNYAMPLIRYHTDDCVVAADPAYVCPCLRRFRVIDKIHGRETDAILTSDGRQHIMPDFIFDDLMALKEAQIVQEQIDAIVINVALHPGRGLAEVRDVLLARARERFGPSVLVDIKCVPKVALTSAGKFPLIVNKIGKLKSIVAKPAE